MIDPYDKKESHALPRIYLCGLVVILSMTLATCRNLQTGASQRGSMQNESISYRAIPDIPSAREQLAQVTPLAEAWETDAKFSWYTIQLQIDMYHFTAIGFDSTSNSKEGYLIYIFFDGRIEKKKIPYEDPQAGDPIIYDNEWPIDSPQALNLLWQQVPVFIQNQVDFGCSFLELLRKPSRPGAPLYWYLNLSDCGSGDWRYLIDAATGEVVHP
jgi:hypothetical protein